MWGGVNAKQRGRALIVHSLNPLKNLLFLTESRMSRHDFTKSTHKFFRRALNFTAQAARWDSEPYHVMLHLEEHWKIPETLN